jgi:hypothetical protein
LEEFGGISTNLQEGDVMAPKFPQFHGHQILFSPAKIFTPVSPAIWSFRVGKYQVCRAWGAARVGQTLTWEDIHAYLALLSTISQTILLVEQLDCVIAQSGEFPTSH